MTRRPPLTTRTDITFPYKTLCLSQSYRGQTDMNHSRLRLSKLPLGLIAALAAAPAFAQSTSAGIGGQVTGADRAEEHTSELTSLMRNSYDFYCLKKKINTPKLVFCTLYTAKK